MEVQGCRYASLPVSRYRVWCLEELRRHWQALDESTQATLPSQPKCHGADPLWDSASAA